jgi:predicted acetyltransferase
MELGGIALDMQIREMKKEDAEQLLHVYQRFTKNYVGLVSRDIKSYRRLMRKKETLGWVALNREGKIIGYIITLFNKETRKARIKEIVVDPDKNFEQIAKPLTDEAYKSLLKKKTAVIYAGSIRNPAYAKIFPKLGFFDVEIKDVFMYSILNVSKFLTEISQIIANRLKQLKQWNGLLQLQCEDHSIFIRKQHENIETLIWTNQKPNLKITLNRELLTKLVFSTTNPTKCFKTGKLQIETTLNQKETNKILTTIFPKKQFLIADFW